VTIRIIDAALFKRALLLFWGAYLSLVVLTNLMDVAKALSLLAPSWEFASGNYAFLLKITARYNTPTWLNATLFAGVVCWEALAAALFLVAGLRYPQRGLLYPAFTVTTLLWGAFVLAEEVFIAYAVEATHWRLFIAQLATLLAVELLPDRKAEGRG
jgi:hypothetical protein